MTGPKSLVTRYQVQQNPLKTERRVELAVLILLTLLVVSAVLGGFRLIAGSEPDPVFPSADSLAVQALKLDAGSHCGTGSRNSQPPIVLAESQAPSASTQGGRQAQS